MAHWPPYPSEWADIQRVFDPRVDRSGGPAACWPWRGARTKGGYGHIIINGREFLTHRLALVFAGVHLDRRECALHACDNPPCCNPSHLRAGTYQDNARDRSARQRRVYAFGEDSPRARLRENDVNRIRQLLADGEAGVDVAVLYQVAPSTIYAIAKGKTWRHSYSCDKPAAGGGGGGAG